MNLPRLAIRNYQFSTIVLLLLIGMGLVSILTMPRSEDPQFDFPATLLRVVYPGTNPLDLEKLVVDPIEDSLNELEDVDTIKTDIEDGFAVINIEFVYGSDPDEKYDDVVAAVARIRDRLPDDLRAIDIQKVSPADVNILQLALTSELAPYGQMKHLAEKLEQKLERVAGVKRVDIRAYPEQQVQIEADLPQMRQLGISLESLNRAISAAAVNMPLGHVHFGERRFTVRGSGDYDSLQQLRQTVIQAKQGQLVYLGDIAEVGQGDGIPNYLARFDGRRAVFVSVIQRKGSNIFEVTEALRAAAAEFETQLPGTVRLQTVLEQTDSVDKRISGFFDNLNQGLLLVGILALIVMGFRASLVVLIAIPVSMLIALGWLDLSGFGLQQMSIVGLVIALGLLVDNAIVVTDNVARLQQRGLPAPVAAEQGASEVAGAVISGTITTILAFVPMLALQTASGTFIRSMPVTVVLTLVASLLVALSMTPLLASRLLPRRQPAPKATLMQQWLGRLARGPYRQTLALMIRHPLKLLLVAVLLLAGSLSLFPQVGVSLFPKAEKPAFLVNIDLPAGAPFEQTYAIAEEIEAYLHQQPLVKSVAANVGRGNPRVYYNEVPKRQTVNYGQLYVQLNTDAAEEIDALIAQLRTRYRDFTRGRIKVKEFMQGPPVDAPVAIRVMGDDLGQLHRVAQDVEQMIQSVAGTVNVDNPMGKAKVDLQVVINRDKAAIYGVPIARIDQTLRTALVGSKLGQYRDERGDDYDIMVRLKGPIQPQRRQLAHIMVSSDRGELIPLEQLVTVQLQSAIPQFRHHNLQRMTLVTADVLKGYQTESVTNAIIAKLDAYAWPERVRYLVGGEQESRKKSFGGMAKAMLVVVLGIFAVLVLQFRSFVQPLIIFAAIPFAITGAILGLWLTGYTFSFTAFVGLTSLVGIVVNNSIILVDYANQRCREGISRELAIIEAGTVRLSPILLTTLTTIGGLLPLTLSGSSMWAPMGWTIIGGMLVSMLLTLYVVPVLYRLMSPVTRAAAMDAEVAAETA